MPELVLAIEISNPSSRREGAPPPGVAIGVRGRDLLGVEPVCAERRHDDDLMPAIDRLSRRLGVKPRDLARIAVSAGPGGFTSVRIAVTTAKLIAEAVGAACIAVPSAVVAARRAGPGPLAVALASKGETTHLTLFDSAGRALLPGRVVGSGETPWSEMRLLVADSFLPASFRDEAMRRGIPIRAPDFDPAACFEASEHFPATDPARVAPLYPREPEAVTRWRQLHPG